MFFSSRRSRANASAAGDAVVRPTRTNMSVISFIVTLVGLSPQFRSYIGIVEDADLELGASYKSNLNATQLPGRSK